MHNPVSHGREPAQKRGDKRNGAIMAELFAVGPLPFADDGARRILRRETRRGIKPSTCPFSNSSSVSPCSRNAENLMLDEPALTT